jgi:predicted unusual protein kinase regulating ubiquinone biosynthesis (AarF/ABC1/UbiB family)
MDYVKVPSIYWEYTTPQVPYSTQKFVNRFSSKTEQKNKLKFILCPLQVLTMEYVPGIKINRIQQIDKLGLDRKRYALNTSQAQL